MGLDMYLRLRKVHTYQNQESFDNAYGSDWKLSESTYTVCDWRKANAIHKWFVDHVQGGKDDCGRYPVTVENLHKLRADCMAALTYYNEGDPEGAAAYLPTASGFFFGCTDYDEYYADDLRTTIQVCSKLIKTIESPDRRDFLSVEYESSW